MQLNKRTENRKCISCRKRINGISLFVPSNPGRVFHAFAQEPSAMKAIKTTVSVPVPEGVKVELKGRTVFVTGPKGMLERSFSHIALELTLEDGEAGKEVAVTVWFGKHKHVACIRTVCAHIRNMIKGVTLGFQYKMKSAYAHFPINVAITNEKQVLEVRNFIGEKIVRRFPMLPGVTVDVTGQKNEIVLRGISLDAVSQSAASIQNSTKVTDKDKRMFLDGIYVSERSTIETVE